ncbi:MAG: ATP-binding protein [Planctomycetes bacterium]|nr:ATP-binding protein [Planctomycetota bacterium]
MQIPSEFEAARAAEQTVLEELSRYGYGESAAFAIRLALEEALNNAIRHGNRRDPTKQVEISYKVTPSETTIAVADQGAGFDHKHLPDPTTDENIEKPTGRGIMLIRAYMDGVHFNKRGNRIRMLKTNK